MELGERRTHRGVAERGFVLAVEGERVPGILWTPEGASGPRPLVLQGHGGTQDKRVANILSLARRLARDHGYAVAAIDAPGHGERLASEGTAGAQALRSEGPPRFSEERQRQIAARTAQAVREWRATLDALQGLPDVGEGQPVGYWGVSMGTLFGVPLVGADPRIGCAVFGLVGLRRGQSALAEAAARVTVPLLFLVQRDDELMTPPMGLALFDAFGSKVKTMHVNPGPHMGIPLHEREYYERFFAGHLGPVARDEATARAAAEECS